MTGRGTGYCVLKLDPKNPLRTVGFAGISGRAVQWLATEQKENRIMPAGDGTGPMGMGRMTGRAAGFCAGFGVPGYANPMSGRGCGMGFGRGGGFAGRGGRGGARGWRNMFYANGLPGWARASAPVTGAPYTATPAPEQELTVLKQQAEYFANALDGILKRVKELETKPAEK